MKKADPSLKPGELVRLRNSGVSADYVQAWRQAGFNCSSEDLIRLRNNGVPSDFAAAVQVKGRKPLSVDTLIRLRNRGVTAAEIRELRE
jgi:hypothetical protein